LILPRETASDTANLTLMKKRSSHARSWFNKGCFCISRDSNIPENQNDISRCYQLKPLRTCLHDYRHWQRICAQYIREIL
jgi:hypothetical protein